jgi:hypothetical protein
MPDHVGAWIRTERGSRRLLPAEELARGLGVPNEWELSAAGFTDSVLKQTTSAFHWEHFSKLLVLPALAAHESSEGPLPSSVDPISALVAPGPEFSWCPTDLSEGGVWYRDRVTNLVAAAHYEDRLALVRDGLRALQIHRSNYTATHPEPQQLQLLWWEFPPEHWDEIRDGCSIYFMVPPTACIHPNSSMTEEQLVIATKFVQELVDLDVLVPGFVLTNGRLGKSRTAWPVARFVGYEIWRSKLGCLQ